MWSRLDLRSVGQRPLDDVRITLEHRKKDHRRTIRPAPALLPVAQSADRNADPSRECVLRQAGSGPDGHHIDALPHMNFRSGGGPSARIGPSFPEAAHQTIEILLLHLRPPKSARSALATAASRICCSFAKWSAATFTPPLHRV